jgi:hypothetical protein
LALPEQVDIISFLEIGKDDRSDLLVPRTEGGRREHNKVGVYTYLFLCPCGTRHRGQEGLVITRMGVAAIGHDEKSLVGLWELKEGGRWVVWGGGSK